MNGFVYVFKNDVLNGLLKIGATERCVEERISEWTSVLPGRITVVWSKESNDPFKLERDIHVELSSFRMPGQKDWFYCSEKHVIDVATKISKNENILLAENIKAKIQRDVRDVFDIGNIIREKRLELNLTQEQLAGAAGVGERFISEIENGKYRAQIGKLIDVIHVLGIRLTTID